MRYKCIESCDISCVYMQVLYNESECCKIMRKDRMKNQMIRLNVRQCHRATDARPIMRIIIRIQRGYILYTANFRYPSVGIVECKTRYRPKRLEKQQPKSRLIVSLNYIRGTIRLSFIFAHFALFVSKRIKTWQILMSHIISILQQHCWGECKARQTRK